ncbi:MAG: hypothetical protein ACP5H8_01830 [Candidatus Micrarchaeia archaeon]
MPWYHALGWRSNPFDYRPSADFFVFEDLAEEVIKYIDSGAVVSTYGIAGIGKTSLLHCLDAKLKETYFTVFLDFRELHDKNQFLTILGRRLASQSSLISKIQEIIRGKDENIVDKINRIIGKRRLVLLVDEAGLLKDDNIASLLATIKDHVDSAIVCTSIEPLSSYEIYKTSFREGRVAREISFPMPNLDTLIEMITKRIEHVGGKGTYPFKRDALEYISRISGYIPRETLINTQNASIYYVDEKFDREFTKSDMEIFLTGKTIAEDSDENIEKIFENMSENQKKIIRCLTAPKTAQELENETGIPYGSLTKEIGRLMLQTDAEMMTRKGLKNPICTKTVTRPYKYVLTKKWRLLFAKE